MGEQHQSLAGRAPASWTAAEEREVRALAHLRALGLRTVAVDDDEREGSPPPAAPCADTAPGAIRVAGDTMPLTELEIAAVGAALYSAATRSVDIADALRRRLAREIAPGMVRRFALGLASWLRGGDIFDRPEQQRWRLEHGARADRLLDALPGRDVG